MCWSTSTRTPTGCRPRSCSALKPDGRGLTVVGDDAQSIYSFRAADGAQHPRLSRRLQPGRPRSSRSSATTARPTADPRRRQCRDRPGAGALHQEPLDRPAVGRAAACWSRVRDEADQARYVAERMLENREAGTALKQQAVLFRTSHHSGPLELELTRRNIPFVKFGGLKFLDAAHVKDVLAVLRFAENPRDRVAGFRVLQLLPGIGPTTAGAIARRMARGADPTPGWRASAPPRAGSEDWPAFVELLPALRAESPAGRPSSSASGCGTSRISSASTTTRRVRRADLAAARADRRGLSVARALPDRADARSAGRDQRRGRRAASRRGLSDPVDHPLGQGPGMDDRLRAQRRRRLHPVRPRHRRRARRSRRNGGCSMSR